MNKWKMGSFNVFRQKYQLSNVAERGNDGKHRMVAECDEQPTEQDRDRKTFMADNQQQRQEINCTILENYNRFCFKSILLTSFTYF